LKKLAVFENWFRVFYAIALGCSFGDFTPMPSSRSGMDHNLELIIGNTTWLFLCHRGISSILRNMAVARP